jgi:calcineurin-like phosphoesterase family protein
VTVARSRPLSTRAESGDAPFDAGQLPPKKVAWLHPGQLIRTAYHAFLSTVATEFLDRREMLAAMDAGDPPAGVGMVGQTLVHDQETHRAEGRTFRVPDALTQCPVWIDYVADIGDSWEATYSTVVLLARQHLRIRGHDGELPAANIVVLGGDLVYPTPSRERYRTRLRSAFIGALPQPPVDRKPALLAIPGNHDWYDGLTSFVREFCQGGLLGGWTLTQRRSYFAAKVARGWWIWGIDIALDTRIDAPQQRYFLDILRRGPSNPPRFDDFEQNDQIILCTAKPVWLEDPRHSAEAYRNLAYFVRELVEKNNGSVPIILSGDLHHYCRYENDLGEQLIVAGGGGAYLYGTHHLPRRVPPLQTDGRPAARATEAGGTTQGTGAGANYFRAMDFPYPSRADSRRLALGALLLAFRPANWTFALVIGAMYWLLTWAVRNEAAALFRGPLRTLPGDVWDLFVRAGLARVSTALAIAGGCAAFAMVVNRGPKLARATWGLIHGAAHILTGLALSSLVASRSGLHGWIARLPIWRELDEPILSALLVVMAAVVGATIVGVYLVVSDRLFGWHRNDVFAAQSIIDYRSFLRIKIDENGTLSIFPIGLRRVPRQWRARVRVESRPTQDSPLQEPPLYEPGDAILDPHLIEAPIVFPRP